MGLGYEDIRPRLQIHAAKRQAARAEQAKMAHGVGQMMAELLADPRWQLWANHVQAVVESEEKRLNTLRDKLSGLTFLADKENGQARVDAAYSKGYRDALIWGLNLAKELVNAGEVAKETLTGGDASA